MKNSKEEVILYMYVLAISGMVYTFLQFRMYGIFSYALYSRFGQEVLSDAKNYVVTISSGIFVSALLAIAISIKNYRYHKKKLLDDIFLEVSSLMNNIVRLNFMSFDEPIELVMKVVKEEDTNNFYKDYNEETKRMSKKLSRKKRKQFLKENIYEDNEAKKELIMHFERSLSEYEKKFYTSDNLDNMLESKYKEKVKKYSDNIENAILSFSECKNLYCDNLTRMIGDLDFLFAHGKKKDIHENIYTKIQQQITYIRRIGSLCDSYNNYGDFDRFYLMVQIKGVQESMIDMYDGKYAYNRFLYELEQELHNLLLMTNKTNKDKVVNPRDFWVDKGCYFGKYLPINDSHNQQHNE